MTSEGSVITLAKIGCGTASSQHKISVICLNMVGMDERNIRVSMTYVFFKKMILLIQQELIKLKKSKFV